MRWARVVPPTVVGVFILACAADPDDSDTPPEATEPPAVVTVAEVDCFGMIYQRDGGPMGEMAESRAWAYDANVDQPVSRCVFQWGDGHEGAASLPAMRHDELFAAMNSGAPFANLNIRIGGREYNSESGTVEFTHFEEGLAAGSYEIEAVNLNLLTGNDDHVRARIKGEFDWCDNSRSDCPHASGNEGLGHPLSIQAPAASGTGEAVACRILHDTASNAIQVDMQVGIWNRINVAEYLMDACWSFGGQLPQGNAFRMRATGVTGPGTYELGPRRTVRFPPEPGVNGFEELRLEYFEWEHPQTFETGLPGYRECDAFYNTMFLRSPPDGGGCTYTVEDGNFEIHCDEVDHFGTGFGAQGLANGPLDLVAECDWVSR